ncbi:MAG: TonB-dependent receptor, partial [Tagaea sp. CACIAM 22H2]|nr:TonB-dependent receptor [Tagaea sp. CACIAM 22H2]
TYEAEINKKFGAWGSTKLILIYRDVEDRVDVVPVGANGEAVGNIAKAKAGAIDWTATINLDPAGLKGVKLDTRLLLQKSSLRDPFTGEKRQWNGFTDTVAYVGVRHDVAGTDWAWGADAEYTHNQPSYRRNQSDKIWEGPVWATVFVEHKNVMGLTVRAQVRNIANARSKRDRSVYTGVRGASPIAFVEERDRLIGPIFSFSARGTF